MELLRRSANAPLNVCIAGYDPVPANQSTCKSLLKVSDRWKTAFIAILDVLGVPVWTIDKFPLLKTLIVMSMCGSRYREIANDINLVVKAGGNLQQLIFFGS